MLKECQVYTNTMHEIIFLPTFLFFYPVNAFWMLILEIPWAGVVHKTDGIMNTSNYSSFDLITEEHKPKRLARVTHLPNWISNARWNSFAILNMSLIVHVTNG